MITSRVWLYVFCVACVLSRADCVGATQEAGTQVDVITTIDGRTREGAISTIRGDGTIQLADGSAVALSQTLTIARPLAPASQPSAPIAVHLAYGATMFASAVELKDERFSIHTNFGELKLPIEVVRAVVFKPSSMSPAATESLNNPSNQFDTVWAEAGEGLQSVSGLVQTIGEGKVSGEFDGQQRSVASGKVVAYIAADLGLKRPANLATLHMNEGSQLAGAIEALADGKLAVVVSGGAKVEIPWTIIMRVDFESDRLVWLGDLQPTENIQEPLVTSPLPTRFNRSVLGNVLSLKSSRQREPIKFDKGLGVHAYSRLVYRNDAGYDRFAAIAGIDHETQGLGDCLFIVRGDGIELWSQRIRSGDEPVPVDVDISNVTELRLIVEPGAQLDLGDHADWCNARLLKTK